MPLLDLQKQHIKFLIIDPVEVSQALLGAILAPIKSETVFTSNTESALPLVRTERPDLIVAACGVNGEGMEFCKKLRQDEQVGDTPVIIITSNVDRGLALSYFEAGSDQVVKKPFLCMDIYAAIKKIVDRSLDENMNKIHVLFKSGETDYVEPTVLDHLIQGRDIVCFKRSSGVAVLGRDPIRGFHQGSYAGPERRSAA